MTVDYMMSETHPLIDVRDLVKRYDRTLVLDGLNLVVGRGETCVIIGGSGTGKSTFARLLVGLGRPDSGEIWIDGVDIVPLAGRALDRTRRKFSVVFQNHALLDSMSVFDNVAFPLREETDLSAVEIARRVHLALRELDVDDAASRLPGELSGGMPKRVGIARAVVTEPEILVYDEPTSGLDPVSSRVVDGLIERMRARHCVTSVVITHDMVTAYDVADRVVTRTCVVSVSGLTGERRPMKPTLRLRSYPSSIVLTMIAAVGCAARQLPSYRQLRA